MTAAPDRDARWELMEMLRRLVLIGFLGLVEPGTVMQLLLATFFCVVSLGIELEAPTSPFISLHLPSITPLCACRCTWGWSSRRGRS